MKKLLTLCMVLALLLACAVPAAAAAGHRLQDAGDDFELKDGKLPGQNVLPAAPGSAVPTPHTGAVPSIPSIPGVPSVPSIPPIPSIPPVPSIPSVPSFPGQSPASAGSPQPWPADGVLWRDEGLMMQTDLSFKVDQPEDRGMHIKIYRDGTELAAMLFIGGPGSATVSIPGGTYTIRTGTGSDWYGQAASFGNFGHYEVMTFDGGSSEVTLESGYVYTITVNTTASPDADSVGSRPTSYDAF